MMTDMKSVRRKIDKVAGDYSLNTVFLLGGLLAFVFFILVYGVRVLDPQYDAWLFNGLNHEDLMQHYSGWLFYRKSSWHFPLFTLMDDINYPNLLPVVFTDSIPLFAVTFKILSPLLPATFQYFGIYGALSYYLLGGFSAVIIYRLTGSKVYSAITSLFCSASVLMLIRVFWHTSLSAHWIVVACIYMMLFKEKEWKVGKSAFYWGLMIFFAVSIHPYFVPFVAASLVFSLIILSVEDDKPCYKKIFIDILVFAAVLFSLYVLLGYNYGAVKNHGLYLGIYSFNYNGFFNTFGYSMLFNGLPAIHWGQYEGYCYLGFPIYVILAVTIILHLRARDTEALFPKKKRIVLIVYSIAFIVFAGSNVLSFGDHYIKVPLPRFILSLWSLFRATGRMIWPVFYLLIMVIMSSFYKHIKKKRIAILACILCLSLQMMEYLPEIMTVHNCYSVHHEEYAPFEDNRWEKISSEYEHICICSGFLDIYSDYDVKDHCLDLELFAYRNDMTINVSFYARDNYSENVEADVEAMFASGELPEDTLFVFLDGEERPDTDLNYYELDGILIGLKETL